MKRRTKITLIILASTVLASTSNAISQYKYIQESRQIRKYIEIMDNKFKEIDRQNEYNNIIENKRKEMVSYLGTDEYKKKLKIHQLREQTGLNVIDYEIVEFELTYYSSLPSENGGYTITCNGKPLEGNIVANNIIPQYTNILLGDRLVYVGDKGAKSIFSTPHRLDVLIERNPGESDSEYLERVNNLGRKKEIGYILKTH